MSSHPSEQNLAPASTRRPRKGLSIWKEARLREKLRTTAPSEPWVEAQIKSSLDIHPNGCAYVYRYLDPTVFPPGGRETKMVRCPICNIFNPPNAFEDGQCLDHPNFDAWGPSPSALAIQKLQIFHGHDEYTELKPEDYRSLQREIERYQRRQQKKLSTCNGRLNP
jgi:hypothetical protein